MYPHHASGILDMDILEEESPNALQDRIRKYLGDGWQPYGQPYTVVFPADGGEPPMVFHYQAMAVFEYAPEGL